MNRGKGGTFQGCYCHDPGNWGTIANEVGIELRGKYIHPQSPRAHCPVGIAMVDFTTDLRGMLSSRSIFENESSFSHPTNHLNSHDRTHRPWPSHLRAVGISLWAIRFAASLSSVALLFTMTTSSIQTGPLHQPGQPRCRRCQILSDTPVSHRLRL